MKKNLFILLFGLLTSLSAFTQPSERKVRVTVAPNSKDWNYKIGDKVEFDVLVTEYGNPIKDVKVSYKLSYDMMTPYKSEETTLKDGKIKISAGTMKVPGFLRCQVWAEHEGYKYEGLATAGFDPEKIKPTTNMPADFDKFWADAMEQSAKIPMKPKLKLLPERCTDKVNVYELSVQNYREGSRIYGILCIPTGEGKFPAILNVPGAGARPYYGDIAPAEKGVITLSIGIHGVPVTFDESFYNELKEGPLAGYQYFNMDDRDKMYYKRVYLGCVRAVDYIFSMKEFDGDNIIVKGGSQGGALAIITAALDHRVKGLIAYYPALCDLTGYYNNRAGGWPHLFKNSTEDPLVLKKKMETSAYYDVVNFARRVKVPGFYSFGYNDMVCPPTSMYSAYNEISAEKSVYIVPEIAHYLYREISDKSYIWQMKSLKQE